MDLGIVRYTLDEVLGRYDRIFVDTNIIHPHACETHDDLIFGLKNAYSEKALMDLSNPAYRAKEKIADIGQVLHSSGKAFITAGVKMELDALSEILGRQLNRISRSFRRRLHVKSSLDHMIQGLKRIITNAQKPYYNNDFVLADVDCSDTDKELVASLFAYYLENEGKGTIISGDKHIIRLYKETLKLIPKEERKVLSRRCDVNYLNQKAGGLYERRFYCDHAVEDTLFPPDEYERIMITSASRFRSHDDVLVEVRGFDSDKKRIRYLFQDDIFIQERRSIKIDDGIMYYSDSTFSFMMDKDKKIIRIYVPRESSVSTQSFGSFLL